jgi:basic amino acid/polyamine antiporter, APA family
MDFRAAMSTVVSHGGYDLLGAPLFRGSAVPNRVTGDRSDKLLRGIGFAGVALIVLNSVIGAGIFALPSAIAARAGLLSPWLFLVCGLLVITVVLTYSELASYFRDTGGPVLYTSAAFGPLTGFSTGWIFFLSRMTAFAANTNVLVTYLGAAWPWLAGGTGRGVAIVVVCSALTWANYVGVRDGVRTVGVLTIFKILPLLLLILLGLPHVGGDVLFPDVVPAIEDLGDTTLLLIYAYVGFEAATITAGETSRPRRNLPRALVATVAATGALYFLIVLVYIAVLPGAGDQGLTLVDLGRELAGPAGALLITATAVFSIGGNLASNMLTVPRLTFALAEQRLLPQWFGRVHSRFRTPGNSILFLGALSLVFALSGSFLWLAAASSLTRLIVYVLCIAALPVIRRRADREARASAFRLKGGYAIPAIALLVSCWIAAQSSLYSWQLTGLLLLAGLLLYGLAKIQRDRIDQR